MYFIKFFTHHALLSSKFQTDLYIPYLHFEHATVFKTVMMNNLIDYTTYILPDTITVFILYPLVNIFMVGPQLLLKGGYFVSSSIYYLGSDMDEYLASKNYKLEQKPDLPKLSSESKICISRNLS